MLLVMIYEAGWRVNFNKVCIGITRAVEYNQHGIELNRSFFLPPFWTTCSSFVVCSRWNSSDKFWRSKARFTFQFRHMKVGDKKDTKARVAQNKIVVMSIGDVCGLKGKLTGFFDVINQSRGKICDTCGESNSRHENCFSIH